MRITNTNESPPPGKLPFPTAFSVSAANDAFLRTIDWDDEGIREAVCNSWYDMRSATRSDGTFAASQYPRSRVSREEMARRLETVIDTSTAAQNEHQDHEDETQAGAGAPSSTQSRRLQRELSSPISPLILPAPAHPALRLPPSTAQNPAHVAVFDLTTPPSSSSPPLMPPSPAANHTARQSLPHGLPFGISPAAPRASAGMAPVAPLPSLLRPLSPIGRRTPLHDLPHGLPFPANPITSSVSGGMAPLASLPSMQAPVQPATFLPPNGLPSSSSPAQEPYFSGMGPLPGGSDASPVKVDSSDDQAEQEEEPPRKRKKVTREEWEKMGPLRRTAYEVADVIDLTQD